MLHKKLFQICVRHKTFSLLECIKNIETAVREVKSSTLKNCWKKLLPAIAEFPENDEKVIVEEVLVLARQLGGSGFDDLNEEDITEMVLDKELHEDDLIQLCNEENGSECEEEQEELPKEINLKAVREGLRQVRELREHFGQCDPNEERLSKFDMLLTDATKPYQELLKDLEKKTLQPKLDVFFTKKPRI